MNNFNKSDFRPVSVTHNTTGEVRTYYVKYDGTEIISAARRDNTGKVKRSYVHKQSVYGGNAGTKVYKHQQRTGVMFLSKDENNKQRGMTLYSNRLVWAAWNNDGVMPPSGQDFHVDHVDGNHHNEHYSNLELVTNTENQRRRNERHAIEAELVVLPCGDITFEPIEVAA